MEKIPISQIEDEQEIFLGTRFRQYNIGLNVAKPEDDYYEYMLAQIPGESDYMLLCCVEGVKSGYALALVKTTPDVNAFVTNAKSVKFSMGTENVFLLK